MFNFLFTKTPLAFLIQSLWRDEGFSYFLAKKNLWDIVVLSAKDFSPPLYHFLLHFWIDIFGSSEIAIRSLSVAFYWATVYAVSHYLTDIFKMRLKKALFYTLLLAVNPLLIYYAFEARMYTMFAFFSVLSFYFLHRKKTKLYLISSILGLYTHYFMIFVLVGQYFLFRFKQKTVLLTFIPWLILVFINKGFSVDSFWIQRFPISSLVSFVGLIYTGYEREFQFYGKTILPLSLAIWLLIIYGYLYLKRNKPSEIKLFKYLFIWGVMIPFFVILVSFVKPIFLPRYLIFANIGLTLLLILIIDKLPVFLKIFVIVSIFAVTLNYHKLQINGRKKANLKKTFKELKATAKNDDVLYVTSELDFFTAQYYWSENKVYIWGKSYKEIPNYVGKTLISKDRIASMLPVYPRRAFILTPDGRYTIKALF
ncbi:glycosyltransferase family 39 protein [Candidatus Roizmanbacteria bacterium]|nr:glycosyltransferase family 39 protein [Candidatus Roizmanbacteria bacterium]